MPIVTRMAKRPRYTIEASPPTMAKRTKRMAWARWALQISRRESGVSTW